jgi:vacuolar-type H+-ATPase subunit C/Vma6
MSPLTESQKKSRIQQLKIKSPKKSNKNDDLSNENNETSPETAKLNTLVATASTNPLVKHILEKELNKQFKQYSKQNPKQTPKIITYNALKDAVETVETQLIDKNTRKNHTPNNNTKKIGKTFLKKLSNVESEYNINNINLFDPFNKSNTKNREKIIKDAEIKEKENTKIARTKQAEPFMKPFDWTKSAIRSRKSPSKGGRKTRKNRN